MKAVVVGAGIGGLATAIGLRNAGIDTVVLERRREPSLLLTGGGFMLWHNALLALRQVKLDEQIAQAGVEITVHEFRSDKDKRLAAWPVGAAAEQYGAPAIALRRSVLNSILMDTAGDCVRLGRPCIGFDQDADGVTVHVEGGGTERCDILVGADGLRSSVRETLRRGHDLPLRYAGYTAWQAIAHLPEAGDLVPSGTFFNLWGRAGLRFLYCRLNPGEVYWDAITSDQASTQFDTMRNGRGEVLAAAYKDWPEPVGTIIRSTSESAILPISIFDRPAQHMGPWSYGRVALLGDAAHPMTLNLSQGAGQAIEDAIMLTGLLSEATDVPDALSRYESARRSRVADMVSTSWQIGGMGLWHSRIRCGMRDLFMRAFFGSVGRRQSYKLMMDVNL